MWYICEANTNAKLITGFKGETTKSDLIQCLEFGLVEDLLNYEPVKPDEAFFIPSRSVHSIEKGILLAEIQQASDLTYRL